MLPYSVFFAVYLVYTLLLVHDDVVGEHESHRGFYIFLNVSTILLLFMFSGYFLTMEFKSLRRKGDNKIKYFQDVWNYTDVVPPIIIIIVGLMDLFTPDSSNNSFRVGMQAIASLGMWLKIFYFLRIFRKTGFFVNMLLRIASESLTFFILFVLILLAFSSSFTILSSLDEGLIYHLFNTYLLGLGEFNTEWSDYETPRLQQELFIVATLVILIIMLNVLIAIVSSAYEKVIDTQ